MFRMPLHIIVGNNLRTRYAKNILIHLSLFIQSSEDNGDILLAMEAFSHSLSPYFTSHRVDRRVEVANLSK